MQPDRSRSRGCLSPGRREASRRPGGSCSAGTGKGHSPASPSSTPGQPSGDSGLFKPGEHGGAHREAACSPRRARSVDNLTSGAGPSGSTAAFDASLAAAVTFAGGWSRHGHREHRNSRAVGRLHGLRAGDAGPRPRRLPPQGARGQRRARPWSGAWSGSGWRWSSTLASTSGSAPSAALEFLTGYLIEKALSVDNLFVFLVIFSYFAVPAPLQHRVLFWGILGALVMRAVFILAGAALLQQFHWVIYVFGAFLVFTGHQAARASARTRCTRSAIRCSGSFRRFVPRGPGLPRRAASSVKEAGRWFATPLLAGAGRRRGDRHRLRRRLDPGHLRGHAPTRSSSSPRTSSPSSACARSTSCSPG